jgi:plasmid stabilization system protein ParE
MDEYEEILPGLGDRFEAEVRAALLRTVELPESAPVYAGEFRRLLVRKFDHGIFYRIHGARIVVTAVLDLRQDPTTIRRRLNL